MIKIIFEIKEECKETFESIKVSLLNVDINEIHINVTEGEIKGSNYIKKAIDTTNKLKIINESKNKELGELINKLCGI